MLSASGAVKRFTEENQTRDIPGFIAAKIV